MSRKPNPKPASNRSHREIDPLISHYRHEKQRPREAEALETLKKVASLVKPLMRARGWKVGTLTEFYPDEQNLLGMNKNRGQEIMLRLRYARDANQFVPMEQVVDTMLHELSHNVFGPHDEKFHALWDQLRDEYEGLVRCGYTGEGFLSQGNILGGHRIPQVEAKRIRRIAAEKRAVLSKGSGQKLGGAAVPRGSDMRKVIADAIERRSRITKGCGSGGKLNPIEIDAISDQASKTGFKTKAAEDQANESAIAQALWELHQEDEKKKYGSAYVPRMGGSAGLESASSPGMMNNQASPSRPITFGKSEATMHSLRRNSASLGLGLGILPQRKPGPLVPAKRSASSASITEPPIKAEGKPPIPPIPAKFWTCAVCTYAENPLLHLCCDVCTAEQPVHFTHRPTSTDQPARAASKVGKIRADIINFVPKTWVCHGCGTDMENQWWTCSTCGTVKLSSKE